MAQEGSKQRKEEKVRKKTGEVSRLRGEWSRLKRLQGSYRAGEQYRGAVQGAVEGTSSSSSSMLALPVDQQPSRLAYCSQLHLL